jgi:hypothetical protein
LKIGSKNEDGGASYLPKFVVIALAVGLINPYKPTNTNGGTIVVA